VAYRDGGRELAEKVREVICEEWAGAGGNLERAVVYRLFLEEGSEVPDYQMSAILNAFRVGGSVNGFASPPARRGSP
jgi:hypothetical protein